MLGAEFIAETFAREGLKRVFTFPGGTIAPVFDACVKAGIEILTARHEQGAGYAALAVPRLTRRPQVVMVTSGPGVTNVATVVADAYFDSTPLVVITGQVGTGDLKSGRAVRQLGFQQVDTLALMRPIAKAVFLPLSVEELPQVFADAFRVAVEGRGGPVVVDLPMDVQRAAFPSAPQVRSSAPAPLPEPDPALLSQAAAMLAAASRPVVLAGQGVLISRAEEPLRRIMERHRVPVAMSLMGLGAVPGDAPLALGFPGHTGNRYAGMAIMESDLVLAVGVRLDVRQTGTLTDRFAPGAKVIHIDLDEAELSFPRVKTHLAIRSDARSALSSLADSLDALPGADRSPWVERVRALKAGHPLTPGPGGAGGLKPQRVVEEVDRQSRGRNVVVTSGVGSHQQWAARHFGFDSPRRAWLTSGGHGAMGYDLPSAVGAQLARPGDLVVCFAGDGSIQMNIQELQTVVDHKLPLKIFVLDNSRLAMVSQFQMLNWASDPTTGGKTNPDFAAVAAAYGIPSAKAGEEKGLAKAVGKALSTDGPFLVHCLVDPEEDVVPMLLGGQSLDAMWPDA